MKRFYFSYGGKTVWKTAPEVVAAAGQDLDDDDYLKRRTAVAALHELHKSAKDAAQVDTEIVGLAALLDDDDRGVRYWTMATMASLGHNSIADYCEQMSARLKDDDPGVRVYAAIGLAVVGAECDEAFDYIPDLQDSLEDSDPQVRIEATKALAEMIEAEDLEEVAQSHLAALKDDRFPIFRASAAESMGYLGEAGLPYVKDLNLALFDNYPRVRQGAAKALGILGLTAMKETCVVLANMAQNDSEVYVKAAAALSLDQMDLAEALEHKDSTYRAWAAEMIANKGLKAIIPVVSKLGELLNDSDLNVRYWSAWALGDAGDPAHYLVPCLLEQVIKDKDPDCRVVATKACVKLDQAAAKELGPEIAVSLTNGDAKFRKGACQCLQALGADSVPQAPGVNECLLDKDPEVRLAAVNCIKNAGKQSARVCGENLGECSRTDEDWLVKKWSSFVLYEFGLAARYGAPPRPGM